MEDYKLKEGVRVTIVGALVNIVLSIMKFFAGTIGNSAALTADAVHSLSDLATDIVAYFSIKISSQAPDDNHPYGHGKAETIGSAIIGASVMFVGVGISWHILGDLLAGKQFVPTQIAIYGAIASVAINETLFQWTKRVGDRIRSESIIANAWHHRTDALSSVAAVIGITGAFLGYPLLDPLAGVVVGIMIVGVGWNIFWEGLQGLMDKGVSMEELERMKEIIRSESHIIDFHELKTRVVGHDTFVDLHIQVHPRISVSEAHNIAETVRRRLREEIDHVADALIHIDAEDDLTGRCYSIDRKKPEEIVEKLINETDGVELDGKIVLHFFLHQVCVDVTIMVDSRLTVGESQNIADALTEKLIESEVITEARVNIKLSSKSIERFGRKES